MVDVHFDGILSFIAPILDIRQFTWMGKTKSVADLKTMLDVSVDRRDRGIALYKNIVRIIDPGKGKRDISRKPNDFLEVVDFVDQIVIPLEGHEILIIKGRRMWLDTIVTFLHAHNPVDEKDKKNPRRIDVVLERKAIELYKEGVNRIGMCGLTVEEWIERNLHHDFKVVQGEAKEAYDFVKKELHKAGNEIARDKKELYSYASREFKVMERFGTEAAHDVQELAKKFEKGAKTKSSRLFGNFTKKRNSQNDSNGKEPIPSKDSSTHTFSDI